MEQSPKSRVFFFPNTLVETSDRLYRFQQSRYWILSKDTTSFGTHETRGLFKDNLIDTCIFSKTIVTIFLVGSMSSLDTGVWTLVLDTICLPWSVRKPLVIPLSARSLQHQWTILACPAIHLLFSFNIRLLKFPILLPNFMKINVWQNKDTLLLMCKLMCSVWGCDKMAIRNKLEERVVFSSQIQGFQSTMVIECAEPKQGTLWQAGIIAEWQQERPRYASPRIHPHWPSSNFQWSTTPH